MAPDNDTPKSLSEETPKNNWKWLTLLIAIVIFLMTGLFIYLFINSYKNLETNSEYEAVYWKNIDSVCLNNGPSWFIYDTKCDSIKTLKVISDDDKKLLLSLESEKDNCSSGYTQAIDLLAFKSNRNHKSMFLFLLLISGCCGAIGVQLRTINNFIGVTCFRNDFDIKIWWPWYILRPFMGFLIGPILYILFDGKLVPTPGESGFSSMVIIGCTILAGYGAEDFLDMLKTLSKRIFGKPENKITPK